MATWPSLCVKPGSLPRLRSPRLLQLAVMFVDDLSSAGRDQFGTQNAVELLRQWCSVGGWHDELKASFLQVRSTEGQLPALPSDLSNACAPFFRCSSRPPCLCCTARRSVLRSPAQRVHAALPWLAARVQVVDSQLIGCMTNTQFQKPVSDRFLHYVSLVALPPISHAGFTLIFTAVLKRSASPTECTEAGLVGGAKRGPPGVEQRHSFALRCGVAHRYMSNNTTLAPDLLPALVSATMELYRHVTATLLPVPTRPHYLFSIRHVGAVFKVRAVRLLCSGGLLRLLSHVPPGPLASAVHVPRAPQEPQHATAAGAAVAARVLPRVPRPNRGRAHAQLVRHDARQGAESKGARRSSTTSTGSRWRYLERLVHPHSRRTQVTDGYLGAFAAQFPKVQGDEVVFVTFATLGGSTYELADHVLEPDRLYTPETLVLSGAASPLVAGAGPASTAITPRCAVDVLRARSRKHAPLAVRLTAMLA